ncbi:Syntenin-1 Melanoma differentiation-associated protein 9 [Triplophysa tibetana]|uniref:Syntenin-1 Melanoma differentiation-associated protein 9 n=1 Tax=Triplophysa tibetana TaxID=1572043 RepID=A0A5A9PPS7_9TELE|nr:Syntenin-1 Melanoma differentiation-associated protein 9 [Triplophysa tibetana]
MSLYPSLEDMKVDKFIQSHNTPTASPSKALPLPESSRTPHDLSSSYHESKTEEMGTSGRLYPELNEFMGLNLSADALQTLSSSVPDQSTGTVSVRASGASWAATPLTGNDMGVKRAEIRQGVREVVLCKDMDGKIGLRLKAIDNGVFVQLVQANTAAALGGLRFGDQILQINGESCAGWSSDHVHKVLKNASAERITLAVRDRPLERTVTLHKDMGGQLGFIFKKSRITSIVKDSSSARNGLLTDHQICEINGQNIIGLKDPQITDILNSSGGVVTVTVMPVVIFEHMMKRMSSSIVKSLMDHAVPEV